MAIALRAGLAGNNGTGGTTLTLTKPTGTVDGDVMLIALTARGGTGTSFFPLWTQKTTPFTGSDEVWAVAYGNGLWVMTAGSGKMATSPDGTTWTIRTSSFGSSAVRSVAYGNGIWVAVGDNQKIATATDPTSLWTQRTNPFSNPDQLNAVSYGNGVWVSAGSHSTQNFATATDPTGTWTLNSSTTFGGNPIRAVVYGGGIWVACGDTGKIGTATNPASTWTLRTNNYVSGDSATALNYGNSLWVTGSDTGKTQSAADPTSTWTSGTPVAGTTFVNGIAYSVADAQWYAVTGTAVSTKEVQTSVGGSTWVASASNSWAGGTVKAIASSGSGLVAGGIDGRIGTHGSGGVGWQLLSRVDSTTVLAQALYWRVASSEPASYVVDLTSALASGAIISLSQGSNILPVSAQYGGQSNASSTTVTAPALGSWTSANGIDVAFFGTAYGTSFTPPGSYTEPASTDDHSTGTTTATATEGSYRALTAVTTVGSIAATAVDAAVNVGHHVFIAEMLPVAPVSVFFIGSML